MSAVAVPLSDVDSKSASCKLAVVLAKPSTVDANNLLTNKSVVVLSDVAVVELSNSLAINASTVVVPSAVTLDDNNLLIYKSAVLVELPAIFVDTRTNPINNSEELSASASTDALITLDNCAVAEV